MAAADHDRPVLRRRLCHGVVRDRHRSQTLYGRKRSSSSTSAAAKAPGKPRPATTIDAAILVEGEARIIRSSTLARRVVERLKLEDNPAYTGLGPLTRLLRFLSPPPASAPPVSKADIAASKLQKQLQVTNDSRSYLINISIVSNSPEWSATLANAFATEYLQHRIMQQLRQAESKAEAAYQEARAFYGDKHPNAHPGKDPAGSRRGAHPRAGSAAGRPDHAAAGPLVPQSRAGLARLPDPILSRFLGMGIFGSLFAAHRDWRCCWNAATPRCAPSAASPPKPACAASA